MGVEPAMNGMADAYLRQSVLADAVNNTTSAYDIFTDASTSAVSPNGTGGPQSNFEQYVKIVVPTIFGLICVLGLFGNLLVIIVVVSDKHMRNTTNILILSLAVADLLFILFCVPFTAAKYALPVWPFGNIGCKISYYAMYVCAYASVYTLVVMSLDRYLAVVHAIRSMTWRSERNTWIIIAVLWVIILASNSPILVQYGEHTYIWPATNETRSTCINVMALKLGHKLNKIFFAFFLFFGYVIPLGVTVLMYGLMLKRLLYGVVPGGGNQSAESIRAKKRVTRMVVIIVVIFALCWLPIQIISFWDKFGAYPKTGVSIGFMMGSNCLAYMNSCVNPILYAFLSENFRRSFKKFLCCTDNSLRHMEYERTNIRFTVTEKEQTTKSTVVSKTYTPV